MSFTVPRVKAALGGAMVSGDAQANQLQWAPCNLPQQTTALDYKFFNFNRPFPIFLSKVSVSK